MARTDARPLREIRSGPGLRLSSQSRPPRWQASGPIRPWHLSHIFSLVVLCRISAYRGMVAAGRSQGQSQHVDNPLDHVKFRCRLRYETRQAESEDELRVAEGDRAIRSG